MAGAQRVGLSRPRAAAPERMAGMPTRGAPEHICPWQRLGRSQSCICCNLLPTHTYRSFPCTAHRWCGKKQCCMQCAARCEQLLPKVAVIGEPAQTPQPLTRARASTAKPAWRACTPHPLATAHLLALCCRRVIVKAIPAAPAHVDVAVTAAQEQGCGSTDYCEKERIRPGRGLRGPAGHALIPIGRARHGSTERWPVLPLRSPTHFGHRGGVTVTPAPSVSSTKPPCLHCWQVPFTRP